MIPTIVAEEMQKMLAAQTVPYESGMVYHPLLMSKANNGFYSDPADCAEALAIHCADALQEHKAYAFATLPETCQPLYVTDLIEAASQDMYEDWYERVTDDCAAEIAIVQAALDALHERLGDFPTFRVDFDRVVVLPAPDAPAGEVQHD